MSDDKTGITVGELADFFDSGGRSIEEGRPRKNTKPTGLKVGELPPELQGTPTDPETGKILVPDLIRDNDLNPDLVGLTIEEIIERDISRIEEGDDGGNPNAVDDRMLVGDHPRGKSSSGSKIKKPKPKIVNTYNAHLSDDGTVRDPNAAADEAVAAYIASKNHAA
jgi:hypothetical protein